MSDEILIAKRTGVVVINGKKRRVHRGVTTAHRDNPLAISHPHLWEPLRIDYPAPADADTGKTREELRADYEGACRTIAEMHAAAVGEVRGPVRGVVEDVADLRAERDDLARRLLEAPEAPKQPRKAARAKAVPDDDTAAA